MSGSAPGRRRRVGLAGVLLVLILVLALALRLKGVAWGLPYSFVNVDESMVVPKAFGAARGHPNPQFFFYPSFFFYLVGAVYLLVTPIWWLVHQSNFLSQTAFVVDPGPYFLLGRLVSVAMGTASVYLAYRLGRVAFGRPAALLAALLLAVVPLHVAYSHMAVTDVTAVALSLLAFVLFRRAADGGGRRWLMWGAVAAGLATSTKYNLGMLVLPATVAAVYACRGEAARLVASGGRAALVWARLLAVRVYAPMLAAFVVASPFVVLDAPHFISDFVRQNRIMDRGWLGFENVGNGFWYNLETNLGGAFGLVLLVLALIGLAWSLWRRTRLDLLIAPYVIVYFVYIGTWKELADRYLLPIVPLLLLLAARAGVEAIELRPAARRVTAPLVVAVFAVALVAPLSASIAYDRGLSGADTRVEAKAWIEANIPAGSRIAVENYGPPLVTEEAARRFREAGQPVVAYRVRKLELPAPATPDPARDLSVLRAEGVEYVVVSSRVYERVRAAAEEYPAIVAFYDALESETGLVEEFRPGAGETGPVLKLYRISGREP